MSTEESTPSDLQLFREDAVALSGKRDHIDGLLRVTAPHEWVILIGLVAAFLAVAGWGLFGSVESGLRSGCVIVQPGGSHAEVLGLGAGTAGASEQGLLVVALVPSHSARRIEAGMRARVLPADSTRESSDVIDAEVLGVSERSVDLQGRLGEDGVGVSALAGGGLSAQAGSASAGGDDGVGFSASAKGHVVRLALRVASSDRLADGDLCTAWIVIERHAPVRWLIPTSGARLD